MIICEILLLILICFSFWELKSTTAGIGALKLILYVSLTRPTQGINDLFALFSLNKKQIIYKERAHLAFVQPKLSDLRKINITRFIQIPIC